MFSGSVGVVGEVINSGDFFVLGNLNEANDAYRNMRLLFIEGGNKGIFRVISSYDGTTKRVRFLGEGLYGAFPNQVNGGDSFIIVWGVV